LTPAATDRASAIRFIVCLGIVSLLADTTYEGARSITGPFFKDLGATAAQVGLIVGLGELCGFTLRLASGLLADRTRAYWTITIVGYAVNLAAVPMLAFAGSWQIAALLVIAERTGKSLRTPARDVLLSEAAHAVGSGWGFGLHAALDQVGAVLGPLFVAWSVARSHSYAPAFLRLAIPAAAAVVVLVAARAVYAAANAETPAAARESGALPKIFWRYVAAAALLAAGFVDFPLIAYHLEKTALARPAAIPLLYAGAMAVNAVTALLLGRLFDRYGLAALAGGIVISLASLPLAFLGGFIAVSAGIACWGTGMGAQDAILRAGIARVVSMGKRGRAFGAFNAVYGVMWFLGSAAMGLLYDHSVPTLVIFGVVAQAAAAVAFLRLAMQASKQAH
jgi:MFS family permease